MLLHNLRPALAVVAGLALLSILPAASAAGETDVGFCLETDNLQTCRQLRTYNNSTPGFPFPPPPPPMPVKSTTTSPASENSEEVEDPINSMLLDPLKFQEQDSPTPPEEDDSQGSGGYGSDDNIDDGRKPGGGGGFFYEQYYVVQLLVRLKYWVVNAWNSLGFLRLKAVVGSLSDEFLPVPSKFDYSQQLDTAINGLMARHAASQTVAAPHISTAEVLQMGWQEGSEEQPFSRVALIPTGSQQAFAIIHIPVSIRYSDWNDLDRKQALWSIKPGQLIDLINVVYHEIDQSHDDTSQDCLFATEDEDSGQVSVKCQPVHHSPDDFLPLPAKPQASMITLSVVSEPKSSTPYEAPEDGIVKTPGKTGDEKTKGKQQDEGSTGSSPPSPMDSATPKKVTFDERQTSREDQGEDGGEDQSQASSSSTGEAIDPSERLVNRFREDTRKVIIEKFRQVRRNTEKLAKVLYEYYILLDPHAQGEFLEHFDHALVAPSVDMRDAAKYKLTPEDFQSEKVLKKKIKKWNKDKILYLTGTTVIEDFAAYVMNTVSITWQLIQKSFYIRSVGTLFSHTEMRGIRSYFEKLEKEGAVSFPYAPYTMPSASHPRRQMSKRLSSSLPTLTKLGTGIEPKAEQKSSHKSGYASTGEPDPGAMTDDEFQVKFTRSMTLERATTGQHERTTALTLPASQSRPPYDAQGYPPMTAVPPGQQARGMRYPPHTTPTGTRRVLSSVPRSRGGATPQSYAQPGSAIHQPDQAESPSGWSENNLRRLSDCIQIVALFGENELIGFVNALHITRTIYSQQNAYLLRDSRHEPPLYATLIQQYVDFQARSLGVEGALQMLLTLLRQFSTHRIVDRDGRISCTSLTLL